MSGSRFVADRGAVVLVPVGAKDGVALSAPQRLDAQAARPVTEDDLERHGATALLTAEDFAAAAARCLNAALSIDPEDLTTAAMALEILVAQQLAKVDADDPVALMEEALRYVFRQERWVFDLAREKRLDGTRLAIDNPGGDPVPLGVHVSNRGKSTSFWVMQDNRLVQGGHAYKIPIQAATALKTAVEDYILQHDIGDIRARG
jgi:hypothetical protein